MLIYNVSVMVQPAIEEAWLQWLKEEHLADVIGTGCFTNATVHRLLDHGQAEGITYVIQYSAESRANHNRYAELYASEMKKRSFYKWGDGFIAFRSLMEVIHHV